MTRDRILLFLTVATAYLTGLGLLPSALSEVPVVPDTPAAIASNGATDTSNPVGSEVRDAAQARELDT